MSTQPTPPSRVGALALVAALLPSAACTVYGEVDGASGEPAAVTIALLDLDGDGAWDGVDLDGDDLSDVAFDADCDRMLVGGSDGSWDGLDFDCNRVVDAAACARPLVNNDDDAFADGIDLDCDGLAELSVQTGPTNCWPAPLDDDGDGDFDGFDLDCDGAVDLWGLPPNPACWPEPIDDAGDGHIDGIDSDCDGGAHGLAPDHPRLLADRDRHRRRRLFGRRRFRLRRRHRLDVGSLRLGRRGQLDLLGRARRRRGRISRRPRPRLRRQHRLVNAVPCPLRRRLE